jgi:putative membrane protein
MTTEQRSSQEKKMPRSYRNRPEPWKGLAAGVIGGLAATVVMSQFQAAWGKASEALRRDEDSDSREEDQQDEDATMKAAGKWAAAGHRLSHQEKKKAGPLVVHYAFGSAMGAVYGLANEFAPVGRKMLSPLLSGSGFGTALFLGADEGAVPALGRSESPKKSPVSSHIYGWASHLVYGLTLEIVRKTVRRSL